MFFVLFFHVVCKISNFQILISEPQASCTELTLHNHTSFHHKTCIHTYIIIVIPNSSHMKKPKGRGPNICEYLIHNEHFLIFWPIVRICAAKVELSFKGKFLPQRKHNNRCVIPNSSHNSTSHFQRTRKLVVKGGHIT